MTPRSDIDTEAFLADLCGMLHASDERLQSEISRLLEANPPDARAIRVLQALDAQSQIHSEMQRLLGERTEQKSRETTLLTLQTLSAALGMCLEHSDATP